MSNNDQTIEFPVALKPLLTDFVVHVLRDRIPSNQLSSYAVQYFSERQKHPTVSTSNVNNQNDSTNGTNDESTDILKQRRKSVWGGSPVSIKLRSVLFSVYRT